MTEICKISEIPFQEINNIPRLIKDFLDRKLSDFDEDLFDYSKVEKKVKAKANFFSSEKREVLHQAFSDQLKEINLSEKQKNNLNSLTKENTFTVTTGHQLNLFTGPVYFIYKILQTIKLADELNTKFENLNFVPIFWMATEDHDFEEINHFSTGNRHYEISAKPGTAVGRIKVEENNFIKEFEEEFKHTLFGKELIQLLKSSYTIGKTLTQATNYIVQALFADYGLLMIDGDDKILKAEVKTIFKNELLHQEVFNTTKSRVDFLKTYYSKVQVNPREINLFYLSDTRNRIENTETGYQVVDKDISFTKEQLLQELELSPENFSPNALLRPVFQEFILPNIAYIGGNAEVMYWLELKDYFKHIGLPYPFIIPRNSLTFIRAKDLKKIENLGLRIENFIDDSSSIVKQVLMSNSKILAEINECEKTLRERFEILTQASTQTDQSFENLVRAEEKRQLKSFEKMRHRLLRAEKIKEQEKVDRIEKLYLDIHPQKKWQERMLNFSRFYSDFGKNWIETSYQNMNIEKSELIIFTV